MYQRRVTAFGVSGMLDHALLACNNGAAVLSSGFHVSNDFIAFANLNREIVFVQRMLVRAKIASDRCGKYVFL